MVPDLLSTVPLQGLGRARCDPQALRPLPASLPSLPAAGRVGAVARAPCFSALLPVPFRGAAPALCLL